MIPGGMFGEFVSSKLGVINPKYGDTVVLWFDPEKNTVEEVVSCLKLTQKTFRDNSVIALPNVTSLETMSNAQLKNVRDNIDITLGENKWFGVVRWCEDDIAAALEDRGFCANEEAVSLIYGECQHHFFKDNMIAAGWDSINTYIDEHADELEVIKNKENERICELMQ